MRVGLPRNAVQTLGRADAAASAIDPRCLKLLEDLRKRCPEIPRAPLDPGTISEPVEHTDDQVQNDLRLLLSDGGSQVVWSDAGSEVLVDFARSRVKTLPHGLLLVGLSLQADQTGAEPKELTVPFAVGHRQRLAGMLATTERKPRGPAVLVDRWGQATIACAWHGLLDLAATYAAQAGKDTHGHPLVPAALIVEPPRLGVVPRAMYDFEIAMLS